MPLSRILQWLGVAAVLFILVGLKYDFKSDAGETVNAPVEDSLSQSLLGYWKMDEGTGTSTTADSSGNANTLTMTAMESGDWVAGQIGAYSLDFDGSAEWLTVSDPASGILDFTDGRDFSISGWFNRDTFTTDDTVVAKRNGIANTDDGYIVYLDDATDQLIFEVSEAGGTDEYQVASTSTFTATGWNHFVAVWDDGNAAQTEIYINGKADGTDTGTIANLGDLSNAVAFDIGAESDNGNPFDGKIDDVRIYGSALPANEVSRLYQTTVPGNPVDTGLVGHWTFDGNDVNWGDTGLEIKDVSGKGNHGAVSGLTTASVTPGKLGQGLSFDGSSYVTTTNISELNSATYLTISVWINQAFFGDESESVVGKYDSNFGHLELRTGHASLGTNAMYFRFHYLSGAYTGNGTHTLGDWEHWTVVFDGTATGNSNRLKMYKNGSLMSLTFEATVPSTTPADNALPFRIASRGDDGSERFEGKIDDVRIYNRALSEEEVLALYNFGS